MTRSVIVAIIGAALLLTLTIAACTSQSTLSSLVTILGNSTASIAAVEGNASLAAQIKSDTTAASAAVLAWKTGTSTAMAIEALNIVEDDLNLIPNTGPYLPLVDLAIGTVESILALLPQPVATATTTARAKGIQRRTVYIAKPPKDSDHFKSAWNGIVAGNPALAPVTIK
jgi:hypothetical protein